MGIRDRGGRIDLAHCGATMAKFMAAPREGHIAGLVKAFAYVKKHLRSKIIVDPFPRDWSNLDWDAGDWREFHTGAPRRAFRKIYRKPGDTRCKYIPLRIQHTQRVWCH